MDDKIYKRLAKVLDTIPPGFPASNNGVELKLLKKVFTPEEAEVFCDLRVTPESAEEISRRTGRPIEGLEDMLVSMWNHGEIVVSEIEGVKKFRMIPWIVGIWEFQMERMDEEFAKLTEEYAATLGPQLILNKPHLMQVVPIEKEIPVGQQAMPYQQVSSIIENCKSFLLMDCVCNRSKKLLGVGCDKPSEICMAFSSEENAFTQIWTGRVVSKDEAYKALQKAEDAALVHLTANVKSGHWYICNCCGCCCGQLKAIKDFRLSDIINSHYYAVIDEDLCDCCGTCLDERCQINAIEEGDSSYRVLQDICIGCGLCISTCPSDAINLVRKPEDSIVQPPMDLDSWDEERAELRGIDFSAYK